jgi:putative DNA primase/helicase
MSARQEVGQDAEVVIKAPQERLLALYQSGNKHSTYCADFTDAKVVDGKRVPSYQAVNGRMTTQHIAEHLAGLRGVLSVPVDIEGMCRFGVIDVDDYSIPATEMVRRVQEHKLPLVVERSKSAGWHVTWFLKRPLDAAVVRKQLKNWATQLGFPRAEIFPKQDRLNAKDKGSGINLPYFGGDGAENYAVNRDGERMTLEAFLHVAENPPNWEQQDDTPGNALSLLQKHWVEGERQMLAFAVAGFLLRRGKTVADCDSLFDAVVDATGNRPKHFREPSEVRRLLDTDKRVTGFPEMRRIMGEEDATAFAAAMGIEKPGAEPAKPFPPSLVHTAGALAALDIPKREYIVDGLILTQTLAMLYAARGLGKTMLALDLAICVSLGKPFLQWPTNTPRQVLYVDGEMATADMQERLRKFVGSKMPDKLAFLLSESFYETVGAPLNFADPVQQTRFVALLDALKEQGRNPDLIVLDNKSALSAGTDENSNSEQDTFLAFLRQLRHRGHAVLIVHHAGKSGDQRGASRNEDFLDLVIKLEAPDSGDKDPQSLPRGAAFRISFTKHRGLRPDPPLLDVELMEDLDGTFTWAIEKPRRQQNWLRVLTYLCDHASTKQAAVADALGIDKSNMSAHIKTLRQRKFLVDGELAPTPSARAYVDAARAKSGKAGDRNHDVGRLQNCRCNAYAYQHPLFTNAGTTPCVRSPGDSATCRYARFPGDQQPTHKGQWCWLRAPPMGGPRPTGQPPSRARQAHWQRRESRDLDALHDITQRHRWPHAYGIQSSYKSGPNCV